MKKFSFILCACILSLTHAEDNYVFEAKGEFAKELKTLIEKHAGEQNASINIYQTQTNDNKVLGTSSNIKYTSEQGKEIFLKKCASCHGKDGSKRASGSSKILKNLSAEEISLALSSYSADYEFGGKYKLLMQKVANSTTSTEIGYIIAYLKGENSFLYGKDTANQNTNIQTTPTEQGIYIK